MSITAIQDFGKRESQQNSHLLRSVEKAIREKKIERKDGPFKEPVFHSVEVKKYVPLYAANSLNREEGKENNVQAADSVCSSNEVMFVVKEWHSSFAYVLCSTGKPTSAKVERAERDRGRLMSWLAREKANGCALSLRYILDPDEEKVTLAIIGTGRAVEKKKSVHLAHSMYESLLPLMLNSSLHFFEPVSEREELDRIMHPVDVNCRRIITRETKRIEVDGIELTAVEPFSFNKNTHLDDFIAVVMNSGKHITLDIQLTPAKPEKEVDELYERLHQARVALEIQSGTGYAIVHSEDRNLNIRKEVPLVKKEDFERKEKRDLVLKTLSQLEALKGGCMMARVEMVSDEEIPSIVTETFRYDFFGPAGRMVVEDVSCGDAEAAYRDAEYPSLQGCQWGGGVHADLVDISQALCVFQLPIPGDHEIPGIPSQSNAIIHVNKQYVKELSEGRGFQVGKGFTIRDTFPLRLTDNDLMHHLYVCGRSGSGKTTLLLQLALSIAEHNEGLCVIDPHGDLASELVRLLPMKRLTDLVYFDPVNPMCEDRLNLLEHDDGNTDQMEMICNEFLGMLLRFIPNDYLGPVYERFLRKTLILAMMAHKTLPDVFRIWQDEKFRKTCVNSVDDTTNIGKEIVEFWENEFPKSLKGDWGSGLPSWFLGKFERFSSSSTMRRVLSAPKTTIDFDAIMNEQKILVVRIPAGILTDVNAYLLGMIVTFKLRQAMLRRANLSEEQRKKFFLVIDEFSNLLSQGAGSFVKETDTFTAFLTEARKHKVSVTLAHQHIGQLKHEMRQAIFGNVQSRIFFPVGAEDAGYIKSEIPNGPEADAYVTMKNYHALAHVLRGQEQIGPFTIQTVVS